MGEGLAASMVTNSYGKGEDQNTKHYYAGTIDKPKNKTKQKDCDMCKKKPKGK